MTSLPLFELLPMPLVYVINDQDEIVSANNQMQRKHLNLQRCPFCFADDETSQLIFQYLLQRVRAGHPVKFIFRPTFLKCDYLMGIDMRLEGKDRVALSISVLTSVDRRSYALALDQTEEPKDLLRVCAWCREVAAVSDQWIKIEHAVPYLRLFEQPHLPLISHGMCADCRSTFMSNSHHSDRSAS